jgi:DNA-binding NarL/FixJ family response regulator
MRGLNGIDATRKISQGFPSVKIIILSMHESEEYYWRALKSGASGYLLKKGATAELRIAVEQVMGGGIYLSRDISRRLIERLPQQMALSKNPLEQLSDRQREILQLIAEGQTTKEIASVLKVSPKTVEYHRAKLMERLRIFDIPGLVRFALEHKLIDLGDSGGGC